MKPVARAAITAGSVVLVGLLALGARTLTAYGVFTDVTPEFAGTCKPIPTANGPEDIAIDEPSGLVFISALDRRAKVAGHPSKHDGLYVFKLADATPHPVKLAGTPSDFHPHGISLVRTPDGGLTLMAINHLSDGTHSIEIFDVAVKNGEAKLTSVGNIAGEQLVSPNAIAALDRDRFYVVNDHGSTTDLGRSLDDYFVLPRANVLYFNGTLFREVARGLAFPSGVVLSPDQKFLYVGEAWNRRVTAFNRQPLSGTLDEAGSVAIPANVDNLRMDAKGQLWAGARPKALAQAAFRADPNQPAPSQVFRIALANGIPQSATAVYTDLGHGIGGASVGAVSGHRMFIGSPLDNHILDCTMDH
ncbi:MAG: SMP-30/gluconolactonase/LRE family protein [Alphaproteobacteria bacterium]|nr:SMP-30/gluconolactonase/LRE family protein [Alphaproteobacteria bacterium]MBL6940044.1 SMP-30/gluconolactonase/LRE family protein [Alphaproteobacteria bacterium]MBL7098100.1 SMP-30/gluconolactonase/LRE family protein [Alphaproteobacteria bacterium]